MVGREYGDRDSPYAERYIEHYEEDDPCICGHTLEWHDEGNQEPNWSEKCNKCECKTFELAEYEPEDRDDEYWLKNLELIKLELKIDTH